MDCPAEIELFWIKTFRKFGIKGDIRISYLSSPHFYITCDESDLMHNERILQRLVARGTTFNITKKGPNVTSPVFTLSFTDQMIIPKTMEKLVEMEIVDRLDEKNYRGAKYHNPELFELKLDKRLERVKDWKLIQYEILNDSLIGRAIRLTFEHEDGLTEDVCFKEVYTR